MKVTNYENSKKLWEIGFKGNFDFAWEGENNLIKCGISDSQNQGTKERLEQIIIKLYRWFPAYDLETILEALPNSLEQGARITHLELNKDFVGYVSGTWDNDGLEAEREVGEPLADTAARLLIKLHEQNLIKFGGDNA